MHSTGSKAAAWMQVAAAAAAHQLVLQRHVGVHLKLQPSQLHIQPVAHAPALQQRQRRRHGRQPRRLRDVVVLVVPPPSALLARLQGEGGKLVLAMAAASML